MIFGSVVLPWTRDVRLGRDLVRRAFEAANAIGDLTFAGYCCNHLNTNFLAAGDPLDEAQREAEHGLAFARRIRFGLASDAIAVQLGLIRTLRGLTPNFGCLDDERFAEGEMERRFSENPDLKGPASMYWPASFRHASLQATMRRPSRPQRARNGLFGHRHHTLKRQNINFTAHSVRRRYGTLQRPVGDGSALRLSSRTTDNLSSGRRIARRISRTAPRWWAPRLLASKTAILTRCAFTKKLSAQRPQTDSFTTRRSPMSALPPSTGHASSTSSPSFTYATHATPTCVGEPMGRSGNWMGYIRS